MLLEHHGLTGDVVAGVHLRLEQNLSDVISPCIEVNFHTFFTHTFFKLDFQNLKDKFTKVIDG